MEAKTVNSQTLAYLGDAVYELYIRETLIKLGIAKVNDLQKETIKYVSAKGQAYYLNKLLEDEFLTSSEIEIVKRARNNKSSNHPKNTDVITYKYATGFEALIGYLHLEENYSRINEIINQIVN